MSLRRKSCDACFKGRRKCDLTYPVCKRCQRNQKSCHYASVPTALQSDTTTSGSSNTDSPSAEIATAQWEILSLGGTDPQDAASWEAVFDFSLGDSRLLEEQLNPSVPNLVGDLGEVQPVCGTTQSWQWVAEQLKGYTREFARHAETPFIHKTLYDGYVPRILRSALGVCAAVECVDPSDNSMLFRILDAEVSELVSLQPTPGATATLLEDLAKVQAMVLFQIIRLFHGDLSQRTLAEQQADLLKSWALQLLRRADMELQPGQTQTQPTWELWIQAESIRRTVMVSFILYGLHSIFKHGICLELPTLSVLPVSTKAESWNSKASYLEHGRPAETMRYNDFATLWLASAPRKLEQFEKVLLVCCKGIEQVEARSCPD